MPYLFSLHPTSFRPRLERLSFFSSTEIGAGRGSHNLAWASPLEATHVGLRKDHLRLLSEEHQRVERESR